MDDLSPTKPADPNGPLVPPSLDPQNKPSLGPRNEPSDLMLGPYRVLKKLGEGGMGAVFLALDTRLDREVALKVLPPASVCNEKSRMSFLREARAAAMVKSDHVVTIFDVGEDRGTPFIAMEYLLGYPLDQFLRVQGNPSLAHVLRIARETALGLAATHAAGLIHRDVKLSNIWLEAPNGRVKLIDFGIARAEYGAAEASTPGNEILPATLSVVGALVGTPSYMSPEQARGAKVDARTDLFSLGVMLYRLCTGTMPFVGDSEEAVMARIINDTPVPPRRLNPRLPESVEVVITKLLAKNPDERFQDARDVAGTLQRIAAGPLEESRVPRSAAADAPTRKAQRNVESSQPVVPSPPAALLAQKFPRWVLAVVGAALLVGGAIAAASFWP